MDQKLLLALCCFFLGIASVYSSGSRVLIVGIDGVRPDALRTANTPHLDTLMMHGISSYDAFTDYPTITFPGFASMLCGVYNGKHKVFSGSVGGNQLQLYPVFMKRVEEHDPAKHTGIFITPPFFTLLDHVKDVVDTIHYTPLDVNIKSASVSYLSQQDVDAMFTYFVGPDKAGHTYGFSPAVPEYINAIEQVDAYVGELISALKSRPAYPSENWLIMVSTDHGGKDLNHGGPEVVHRKIFTIFSRDSVPAMELKGDTTLTPVDAAMKFTGDGNFASIPYQPVYDFGAENDFTVELWFKPESTAALNIVLSNQDLTDPDTKGFTIAYNLNNSKTWLVNMGDGNRSVPFFGGKLADTAMHHIGFSVNRNELITLYQNGVNINAGIIGYIEDITTTRPISLGQDGLQGFPGSFEGSMKELRIWNAVISEEAMAQYAGKPIDSLHPFFDRLIGYWKLDASNSDTLTDSSPTGNAAVYSTASVNYDTDTLNLTCVDYSATPRIVDIAYEALSHMCVPIRPEWELDGTSRISGPCEFSSCEAVSGLSAINLTETTATLQWQTPANVFYYILRGREYTRNKFIYVNLPPGATQLQAGNLKPGTEYLWQILAVCDTSNVNFSPWSQQHTFHTLPSTCLSPDTVYATEITGNSAQLNWSVRPEATGYRISGRPVNSGIPYIRLSITPGATDSFEVSSLSPGVSYEWFIQAICPFNQLSDPSNTDIFTTLSNAPKNLQPEVGIDHAQWMQDTPLNIRHHGDRVSFSIPGTVPEATSATIYDVSGRNVIRQYVCTPGEECSFSTLGLSPGIYLLQLGIESPLSAKFMVR